MLEEAHRFFRAKVEESHGGASQRKKEEEKLKKEEQRALTEAEQLYEQYERREVPGKRGHKEEEELLFEKSKKDIWSEAKANFGKIWGKGPEGCSTCVKSLKEKGVKDADALCRWLQSFGGN